MRRKWSVMISCVLAAALMAGCGASEKETTAATTAETTVAASEEAAAAVPEETKETEKGDASGYPDRPVSAVVAWKVGGGQDLMVRAVAASFKEYANGQPLVISNVEGGSSVQGVTEYLGYEEDGYNLLSWATAQTIKTHMQETKYAVDDFQPIANMVSGNPYILVRNDSPFETVSDLVEYAKANPGKLTIGNSGAGGGNHLAALQFCLATEIEANHIGYDGGSASAQATLSGEVDCSVNVPSEGLTSVESGELRMLCLLAEERSQFFPDVPTAKELGFDVVNNQDRGFVIHKSVPKEVVEQLESIFKKISENEEFQKQAKELNMEVKFLGTEDYTAALKEEDAMYKEIIQLNKLGEKYGS